MTIIKGYCHHVEKWSVTWGLWSERLKPPQKVRDYIDSSLPEFFRHWALSVGDDLWELGTRGDVAELSEDRLRSEEESQGREFDEYFVGMTTDTKTQIDRKGECRTRKELIVTLLTPGIKANQVLPTGSHYHLVDRNCQTFVQGLSAKIERTPQTLNMTEREATHRFCFDYERLIRILCSLPERARDGMPESVREYIDRMKRWLLTLLSGNIGVSVGLMLPYLVALDWPELDQILKMLRQAGSYMSGGAEQLLAKLIDLGPTVWGFMSNPLVVKTVLGGVVLLAVWEGAKWLWTWYRCKAKDLADQGMSMELQRYVFSEFLR
jgi:hypothetical protein